MEKLGKVLQILRENREISQSKVAKDLTISQHFLSMIENLERQPKPDLVASVISYCDQKAKLTRTETAMIFRSIIEFMLPGSEVKIIEFDGNHVEKENTHSISVELPNIGSIVLDTKIKRSTKMMRSDVQDILKAATNNAAIRDAFQYFSLTEERMNFITNMTQNKKQQNLIEKLFNLSNEKQQCIDKLVSVLPALDDDKLPVILSVVNGLLQS